MKRLNADVLDAARRRKAEMSAALTELPLHGLLVLDNMTSAGFRTFIKYKFKGRRFRSFRERYDLFVVRVK
jgi:hypothetical protein